MVLTKSRAAALANLQIAYADTDIIVIGAAAIACHVDMAYRTTDDLDLAVDASLDDFPTPIRSLPGWTEDPSLPHRFSTPTGDLVDILPAGTELLAQGYDRWSTGAIMRLTGFDLAFKHAAPHDAGHGVTIRVPPAAILALLKMCAWLDRPAERHKDLVDLAHVFEAYLSADDDRRWSDEVVRTNLDYEDVSAFVLGQELRTAATPEHLEVAKRFLTTVSEAALATAGPAAWRVRPELARRALDAFGHGAQL